jgi:hypothetical protein
MFFTVTLLFSQVKSPSDVYSESIILKKMLVELRKQNGITEKLQEIPPQKDKLPRHVLQKTLEILTKVNKYREINNFGEITVPPVPPRDITPQDVYNNVERLKIEVAYLFKDKKVLAQDRFKLHKYFNKTPSDAYRELWVISLAFDKLLGQGFTPTDVYIQTVQIVKNIEFLRNSQREHGEVAFPKLKENQHPNHALYKSIELIEKLSFIQKKLWMQPVPVPKVEQKRVSPIEVYDSLQTVNAELNRISRRLGLERSFPMQKVQENKTPGDVVQNLEYAIALLPTFSFKKVINQYPKSTLTKTPNDVFALSEQILNKLQRVKLAKGINSSVNETQYIYGLKPVHVYVKGIEALEKVAKLKQLEGFKPSESPIAPDSKITPSEVYELILRLDNEINLLYSRELQSSEFFFVKKQYSDKTPSDAYDNLWKISYELDSILNLAYTPNETYLLARNIELDILNLTHFFLSKNIKIDRDRYTSKKPSDVFALSLKLLDMLQVVKDRGNLKSVKTTIPQDKVITPTSVYNALRIISATISEINIYYGMKNSVKVTMDVTNKTPSDVYSLVDHSIKVLKTILEDSSYEN